MRSLPLVLSAALVALAAAACGAGEVGVARPGEGSTASSTVESSPPPSTTAETRTITVGGMGSQYARPDRAVLDIGVTVRRPTVVDASRSASVAAQALTDALRAAGVADEHVQTSEFSVYPYHDDWPTIAGYETTLGYRVTMPDVTIVADVLEQGVEAGGDDVRAWGIRFETDPVGLMEAAREQAWADVMGRAAALAELAGEPLGGVLDAHEKVLVTTPQGMYQGGEGDSAAFDIPVSPGQAGVVVLLTVTFAIGAS